MRFLYMPAAAACRRLGIASRFCTNDFAGEHVRTRAGSLPAQRNEPGVGLPGLIPTCTSEPGPQRDSARTNSDFLLESTLRALPSIPSGRQRVVLAAVDPALDHVPDPPRQIDAVEA